MSGREHKVGVVGTFDVENYGDLLFPLIARGELAGRLGRVELLAFSYRAKTAAEWPYPVISVTELPRIAPGLDAMLIGGGYLARFDKAVAPGYAPPTAEIHHPTGYWLTPALICLQHGVPLVWNTPGANYEDIPSWADPLLELAFSQSSYIAVRDEPSRAALERFAGAQRIEVVPDTGFGLSRWLPERPTFEFNRLRDASGLSGPYILIQGVRGLEGCHRFLKRHADRLRGYRFLALPIGPVNGDDDALADADLPGLVRLPVWPQPLLLAELIRQAAAVIGPSYHLAVSALTAGVPVFTPADLSAGKFPGLAELDGIHPLPAESDRDAEWFVSRLGKAPISPRVAGALDRLAAHWDRVAAIVRGGATETAVAIGRFWQSLPGLLEGHAARCDAALTALQTRSRPTAMAGSDGSDAAGRIATLEAARSDAAGRIATLEAERSDAVELGGLLERARTEIAKLESERADAASRISELSRLVALARTEIAARDRRIGQFLASTSWKVTSPLRFVGRRLGR
jgi:lipopolysaccharide transport system ATP-binding protein